jgi:hypothetical protein
MKSPLAFKVFSGFSVVLYFNINGGKWFQSAKLPHFFGNDTTYI